jgi:uncharacterized membrane-anchored protein YhcB (DUF1043 family)
MPFTELYHLPTFTDFNSAAVLLRANVARACRGRVLRKPNFLCGLASNSEPRKIRARPCSRNFSMRLRVAPLYSASPPHASKECFVPVSEDQLVPVIIGAVIGLFIGYFFGRRGAPGSEENRELQRELSKARDDQARFEQRVNAHFADTAGKLNTLTENYREVYAQIATGAADLCSTSKGPRFEALAAPGAGDNAADAKKEADSIDADSVQVEPPRDYAPKSSPDEPGALDEKYGMDESDVPPEHVPEEEQDKEKERE